MVWLESMFQDLRYALRMMRRTPLVTTVAVLSLALGIGANTAIFSVLDGFLLKLLPVKNPREIVLLSWLPQKSPASATDRAEPDNFSFPMFERFRRSSAVSGAAGFAFVDRFNVIAGGRAEFALSEAVSGNYHAVLGVAPVIGRAFTDDDDRESAEPVCVISHRFWMSRFAGDPTVIGRKIVIANVPITLVGVEPKEFLGLMPGYAADVRIPFHALWQIAPNVNKSIFLDPDSDWVWIAARVPRTTEAQARAELTVLLQQSLPPDKQGSVVRFGPAGEGLDLISGQFRSPLLILMAAVGLVLLIACANVANLLLVRAQAREKETSTRLALGAGRARVFRQFLTESLLLAAAGGTLGIILAYRAGDLLARGFTDLTFDVHPDIGVLMFTAGVTLLTGILFGLAPAIRAARVYAQPGLHRDTRPSRYGLPHLLIVGQLALSMVALVGAGLYVRTLHNLRVTDLGIKTHNVTVFRLVPGASGYTNAHAAEFAQRVLERLERMPGVESVAQSRILPLQGSVWETAIDAPGLSSAANPSFRKVSGNLVSARFFETMGIPVLLGRGIEERDRAGATQVAVINEMLERAYFPHESPLGRHFRAEGQDYEIVGVVGDGRYNGIRREAPPMYFVSLPQSPDFFRSFGVEIRTSQTRSAVASDVRRAIAEIDPSVPLSDLATMDQTIDRMIRQDRLFAGLSTIFGALALLLAAVGLYGVRAYAVARRTQEIGIRIALGADRGAIVQMILRETGWLGLLGVTIGLGAAYAVMRYIQAMLFGIAARDFGIFAGAAALLIAIAALAGYLPARRASRVDPMIALRHE
jgi:predicted permease